MVNATYRGSGGRRPRGRSADSVRHSGRRSGLRLAALALAVGLSGLIPSVDAFAQASKDEASEQKKSAGIQRAYAAGTKAFEAGDMATAEQQLSVALAGGGLPNSQMARALYLRGAASRRLGKPAQAISDLTTAVWLKGGLSDSDKAKATEERQLAYREAGLGDTPPPIGAAPLDQAPRSPSTPAPATGAQVVHVTEQSFWNNFSLPTMPSLTGSSQPAPAAPEAQTAAAQTADGGQQSGGFWSFLSGGSSQQADAASPTTLAAAVTPVSDGAAPGVVAAPTAAPSSWDTQTAAAAEASAAQQLSAGYAPVAPAAGVGYAATPEASGINPLAAPSGGAAPASNPLAGSGTAVSNFFGNIFGGGGTQAAQTETAAVTPVSTGQSQWGPDTTVVTAQTSSMVQRGPDSPPPPSTDELPWGSTSAAAPAPVKVAATGGAGKYKLQVAAVRSREEAERLAQSLQGYQPVRDGMVAPEVDEAVIGSMGTFYRVRLGPYADAKEPGQLCKTLKPQGFDCLVVTQ